MATIGTILRVWTIGTIICSVVWILTSLLPVCFRLPIRTLLVALVVTPSVIVGPHEGQRAILPALFVLVADIMDRSWELLARHFVMPVVIVWIMIHIVTVLFIKRRTATSKRNKSVA